MKKIIANTNWQKLTLIAISVMLVIAAVAYFKEEGLLRSAEASNVELSSKYWISQAH